MKVTVVNSAGGSFCWNYATDTFYNNYVSDNTCGIDAGFEVVLSVTVMFVDLSLGKYADNCFCCNYVVRSFCSTYAWTVSAANIWVTLFIVIMQMAVSVAIMQVLFSAVQYAHDCFYCNYAGDSFYYSYVGNSFK